MSDYNVPDEIQAILIKNREGKATKVDKEKLNTYLGTLEHALVDPTMPSQVLVNPNPIEVDVSLQRPQTLEERVRRIMSVSSRIAEAQRMETAEEADDFQVTNDFDVMPNSPFEMVDHFAPMQPESPPVDTPDPDPVEGNPTNPEPDPPATPDPDPQV
jgi:hypothetical protein